jgi:hypothetical protein
MAPDEDKLILFLETLIEYKLDQLILYMWF